MIAHAVIDIVMYLSTHQPIFDQLSYDFVSLPQLIDDTEVLVGQFRAAPQDIVQNIEQNLWWAHAKVAHTRLKGVLVAHSYSPFAPGLSCVEILIPTSIIPGSKPLTAILLPLK